MPSTTTPALIGDRLADFLHTQFNRRLSVSFMANQVPQKSNRIELHPHGPRQMGPARRLHRQGLARARPLPDGHDRRALRARAAVRRRWRPGHYPIEGFGGVYSSENALARIANHILGGARFGTDPNDSVLDPNCRAWHFDNLYVTDGCFMPTSGSGNPTLTIQANAFRVGDALLASGLL